MQITVTGHHVDITDSMRDYVTSKLERLERHFDHVTNVNVVLGVEKLRQTAEATINMSGAQIHAQAEQHENMYAAIDMLVDKLDRQILKHKEKLKNHKHKDAKPALIIDEEADV